MCRNRCFRCVWNHKFNRAASFVYTGRYGVPTECRSEYQMLLHSLVACVSVDDRLLRTSDKLAQLQQVRPDPCAAACLHHSCTCIVWGLQHYIILDNCLCELQAVTVPSTATGHEHNQG